MSILDNPPTGFYVIEDYDGGAVVFPYWDEAPPPGVARSPVVPLRVPGPRLWCSTTCATASPSAASPPAAEAPAEEGAGACPRGTARTPGRSPG